MELWFNDFQNSTSLLAILKIIPGGDHAWPALMSPTGHSSQQSMETGWPPPADSWSQGVCAARSWERQTRVFSPDAGLMRPQRSEFVRPNGVRVLIPKCAFWKFCNDSIAWYDNPLSKYILNFIELVRCGGVSNHQPDDCSRKRLFRWR